jgi:hypothetical protein
MAADYFVSMAWTAAAKRRDYRDFYDEFVADVGGLALLSEAQKQLIRAAKRRLPDSALHRPERPLPELQRRRRKH